MPGLLGAPDLLGKFCFKEMFRLLFCKLAFSLLIGAPTSSGGFILLLIFFVLGLLLFPSGLFETCLLYSELEVFLEDSLDLTLLFMFLGFAIN